MNLVKRIDTVTLGILSEYPDLFQGFGCLPGEVKIQLKNDAEPVIEACRKVPFKMEEPVKQELQRMQKAGIIEPVEEPTEWVNAMHVVYKPNGQLRVCLDPRNLNKAIRREHFKLPTREEIMSKFAGATVFSKLDATKGFWQLKLTEEASKLCTFITPVGRFSYRRLPFGISSAPEIYHRTIYNLFAHLEGVDTSMDDIIISGHDRQEHDKRLKQVLDICRKFGLKLNKDKCQVGVNELTFLGDTLSDKGVQPDKRKVDAIVSFPSPENREEVQRFLGMINYLARFLPDLSTRTYHLRLLLKKEVAFNWGSEHQKEFAELKTVVSSAPILQFYDPNLPIKMAADSSKVGLGALLQQKHGSEWKPVAYASRTCTDAESRYAPIERETLAIEFAAGRFHQYIYGQTIETETDHKPLVAIFSKSLNECPSRIQRMRLKLQKYDLVLKYLPGNKMFTADTLSRGPVDSDMPDQEQGQLLEINDVRLVVNALALKPVTCSEDHTWEEEVEAHKDGLLSVLPVTDRKKELLRVETKKDVVPQTLQETILNGWPDAKQDCPIALEPYWNFRDEMSCMDGLILKATRIVVPTVLRMEMLEKIHVGHLGREKCKRRARNAIFWPGLNKDIDNMIEKCAVCLQYQPSQAPEPLLPHPVPSGPWEKVGVDLCNSGRKNYLIIVDYFSNFPEVYEVHQQTSSAIIRVMKECFARAGIPYEVFSDNGPCFDSAEFRQFANLWDFRHSTSSPHFAQSNGLAEGGVKIAKAMLQKCLDGKEDTYLGLLSYRGTPLENGLSPAEIMYGRRIRTNLPMIHERPSTSSRKIAMNKVQQKLKQKLRHDQRGVKPLDPLKPGETVRVQNSSGDWMDRAVVVKEVAPRSYVVKTEKGSDLRRNRRDLLRTTELPPTTSEIYYDALEHLPDSQVLQEPQTTQAGTTRSTPFTVVPESSSPTPHTAQQATPCSAQPSVAQQRPRREIKKPQRLIEN
jgi:hypothetical protein